MFKEEVDHGYTVEKLIETFEAYSIEAEQLKRQHCTEIELLIGFETEVVSDAYFEKMSTLRNHHAFDYIVGSVHHVSEICIDAYPQWLEKAIQINGGLEPFAVNYYCAVGNMVDTLKPEVVGHLDLIKKFADIHGPLDTPKIRAQVERTLSIIKKHGSLLDLNVYPLRAGKPEPYPASWIVDMAKQEDIEFCFGDDSHSPSTVGVGIDQGREYLLSCAVESITVLTKINGQLVKEKRAL